MKPEEFVKKLLEAKAQLDADVLHEAAQRAAERGAATANRLGKQMHQQVTQLGQDQVRVALEGKGISKRLFDWRFKQERVHLDAEYRARMRKLLKP